MRDPVELILAAGCELGEGPVWDARTQRLLFVDILRGRVIEYDPRSGHSRESHVGRPVGLVMPTRGDDYIAAAQGGFFRLDLSTGELKPLAAVDAADPDLRMNDGNCDGRGRFWAGTLSMSGKAGAAALHRLDTDGRVSCVLTGISISNGIDWSPDGGLMYYVDTPTGGIDVFDFDDTAGTISNGRPFVTIAPEDGQPDGLTVDGEGGIWVALWRGAAVRRYRPDGRLDDVLSLPVECPTSCAFGGPDYRELFITTARPPSTHSEPAKRSLAGGLFCCRPGVQGRSPTPFAG